MPIVIPLPENVEKAPPRSIKAIVTHEGKFHQDESFACFLLRQTKQFGDYPIIRARNTALFAAAEVVLDVGGVYDHSQLRYDHHQKGFDETMQIGDVVYKTKLSSAGLIWRHYGQEIVQKYCECEADDPIVGVMYNKLYQTFVEAVDGNDNGVSRYPKDIEPLYSQTGTDLSSRIASLNPLWNEDPQPTKDIIDSRFETAMLLAQEAFEDKISYYAKSWWPARAIVERAIEDRFNVHESGAILVLDRFCPWKVHLLEIEEERQMEKTILYVTFESSPQPQVQWMIGCAPLAKEGFGDRKSLPKEWRGLRDQELDAKSGIENCVFVHASGFLGANKTKEGALAMCAFSVEDNSETPEAKKAKNA